VRAPVSVSGIFLARVYAGAGNLSTERPTPGRS